MKLLFETATPYTRQAVIREVLTTTSPNQFDSETLGLQCEAAMQRHDPAWFEANRIMTAAQRKRLGDLVESALGLPT